MDLFKVLPEEISKYLLTFLDINTMGTICTVSHLWNNKINEIIKQKNKPCYIYFGDGDLLGIVNILKNKLVFNKQFFVLSLYFKHNNILTFFRKKTEYEYIIMEIQRNVDKYMKKLVDDALIKDDDLFIKYLISKKYFTNDIYATDNTSIQFSNMKKIQLLKEITICASPKFIEKIMNDSGLNLQKDPVEFKNFYGENVKSLDNCIHFQFITADEFKKLLTDFAKKIIVGEGTHCAVLRDGGTSIFKSPTEFTVNEYTITFLHKHKLIDDKLIMTFPKFLEIDNLIVLHKLDEKYLTSFPFSGIKNMNELFCEFVPLEFFEYVVMKNMNDNIFRDRMMKIIINDIVDKTKREKFIKLTIDVHNDLLIHIYTGLNQPYGVRKQHIYELAEYMTKQITTTACITDSQIEDLISKYDFNVAKLFISKRKCSGWLLMHILNVMEKNIYILKKTMYELIVLTIKNMDRTDIVTQKQIINFMNEGEFFIAELISSKKSRCSEELLEAGIIAFIKYINNEYLTEYPREYEQKYNKIHVLSNTIKNFIKIMKSTDTIKDHIIITLIKLGEYNITKAILSKRTKQFTEDDNSLIDALLLHDEKIINTFIEKLKPVDTSFTQ